MKASRPLSMAISHRPRAIPFRLGLLCMSSEAVPRLTLSPTAASLDRAADPAAVYVVSGGSRGIGLQFCKSFLERTQGSVIALSREPERSAGLDQLRSQYASRIRTVAVDLASASSITAAGSAVAGLCSRIDVLINCAGILHENSPERMPERSLASCSAEWMHHVYAVNAMGPVLLTSALLPLLSAPPGVQREKVVANLSARVGSVSDNRLGGWWSYRMSKAALNMATRNMALELRRKKVIVLALHPGTTATGLSQPFQKGVKPEKLFTTEYSVDRMLSIIESAEDAHSGNLFAWDGELIPF